MTMLTGRASVLPVNEPSPTVSVSPVVLDAPGRPVELQVRVTAPVTGRQLPVILLSHGHGRSNNLSSLNGYGPLAQFWAARGFVVIQPTHLSSTTLQLDPTGPEGPLFWRSRAQDMSLILDQLDRVESAVPQLAGRLDRDRVAVVGHSLGGLTAGMLLGQQLVDENETVVDMTDSRIRAGIVVAAPGNGADLADAPVQRFPILRHLDFASLTAPALVVAGDKDLNPAFSERADWRADAYHLSTGPKWLLTVFGGEHMLGGISGWDAAETKDEDPERVAAVQRLTWSWLRTALHPDDPAWPAACAALADMPEPLGRVDSK